MDPITRRKFLKRTGGATVGALVALNQANSAYGMGGTEDGGSSWSIVLDGANPGDGANAAVTGEKSKYGWNWKSALVNVAGSNHLLVLRWKCTPNPKHPEDLVDERALAWEFDLQVVAQVRSTPITPPSPLTGDAETYMIYDGMYYSKSHADAGWSEDGNSGSSGTVLLKELLTETLVEGKLIVTIQVFKKG